MGSSPREDEEGLRGTGCAAALALAGAPLWALEGSTARSAGGHPDTEPPPFRENGVNCGPAARNGKGEAERSGSLHSEKQRWEGAEKDGGGASVRDERGGRGLKLRPSHQARPGEGACAVRTLKQG